MVHRNVESKWNKKTKTAHDERSDLVGGTAGCRAARCVLAAPRRALAARRGLDLQPLDSRKTLHCRRVQPQGVVCVLVSARANTFLFRL